jgi:hypothetical protein
MYFMKNSILTVVLFLTMTAAFPQARIQILHNSPDVAIEMVDIWLDNTLILDNFRYRKASTFMDAPAGTPFTLTVAASDSQDPGDPLWQGDFTLTDGETYVMVAEGIISLTGYDPATPFDVALYAGARETASGPDMTDMLSHHGSTDTPTIDIYETGVGLGQLVDNLSYSEFDGYDELSTKNYILEVRDESGINIISAFNASFLDFDLKGKAMTLVASGFMYPENNSGGPAFGLWAAPATGGAFIELPPYNPKARLQIINNSADALAQVVDVWLNDSLLLDNFEFREASAFMDVRAESEFTLAVKASDSQDPDNPLWSANYTLTTDQTYIMVAQGILSASGYDPATPFDISVYPQGRETALQTDQTDLIVEHGSTDAPVIDIYEVGTGAGILVDNLAYGQFSDYLSLDPLDYILEIRDQGGVKIAAYKLPLETTGLDGFAISIVASGFLDPGNNSNGPAFGLWMATAQGGNLIELEVYDPKARVQFIHNSADAALEEVDVWLNNDLILDNFAFRTASPFVNAPANQEFTIAVKGPDSQNPSDPLWSQVYTMPEGGSYLLVAEGIISTSGYDPATPFSIAVFPNAREEANSSGQTDMLMHHGSTDTPPIDIVEVGIGLGQMVDNLTYGQFAGYFGLATVNYIFQVRDETGLTKIAAYLAPFGTMGLQGEAITVLASGFLVPDNNSGGPAFGLYMAQAEGGPLIKLPEYAPKARLQFIHNSADTALDVVDVWLNQTLIGDNMAFRSATSFIDAPANEQITVAVKGPDSQDPYGPLFMRNFTLTEGETYIIVAEGIISQSGFEPLMPFDIPLYTGAREDASIAGRTDILFHHGSTDLPMVDIVEVELGAGILVQDFEYTEFTSYLELPTIDYVFEVRDSGNDDLLGTFRATLQTSGLENKAITVLASGFLDPTVNSDGAPFGLWAALSTGGPLIELPQYVPSALVQFIHNSGDAAAAVVDVWLDQNLLIDNFVYRHATPFTYIPANTQITLAVCTSDSQDPSNPLYSQGYTLTEDAAYTMVASGIISPEGYDPLQPFAITAYADALLEASVESNTDVVLFHNVTDGPTVDISEPSAGTLADNLSYGMQYGYVELPTANYLFDVTDDAGATLIARFSAPLSDLNLGGEALSVLMSGFIDPSVNNNGPEFGLLAVKTDGTAYMLTNITGIDDSPVNASTVSIYPNPATSQVSVSFELTSKDNVTVEVIDLTGKVVKSVTLGVRDSGNYNEKIGVNDLSSGLYMINIRTANGNISRKLMVE